MRSRRIISARRDDQQEIRRSGAKTHGREKKTRDQEIRRSNSSAGRPAEQAGVHAPGAARHEPGPRSNGSCLVALGACRRFAAPAELQILTTARCSLLVFLCLRDLLQLCAEEEPGDLQVLKTVD